MSLRAEFSASMVFWDSTCEQHIPSSPLPHCVTSLWLKTHDLISGPEMNHHLRMHIMVARCVLWLVVMVLVYTMIDAQFKVIGCHT